jgi:hypothetical protein
VRIKRRMARIEGREPKEEELAIPPLRVSFPKAAYIIQPDKGLESLGQELLTINTNTLEEDKVKGEDEKIEAGNEDEVPPQLAIHTLEIFFANTFMRKLAKGEKFQN